MRHQFARKGPSSQSYGFPSSHVHMIWELDHKEGWVLRNWCFWTMVLQKTLPRVAWTAKRSNQSILKEINPEYSLEGLMLKLKFEYYGYLMQRVNSLEKTLFLGKTEQEVKGATEDKMVGWHHRLNGHEFDQTLGDGEGKGSLAAAVHGVLKTQAWLSDWTTIKQCLSKKQFGLRLLLMIF